MKIKKIFKSSIIILTLMCISICLIPVVKALTYTQYTARTIAYLGLNVRSSASSNATIVGSLPHNSTFTYTDSDIVKNANDSCNEWIYVASKNGYVCKEYTEVTKTEQITDDNNNEMSGMTDAEFDAYLNSQGFPESYKTKLKELHKKYPSWVFKGVKTNRDWTSTVKEESEIGYSTYYMDAIRESAGHEAYLNTDSHYDWSTNLFTGYDGWFFLANEQTVAYFLDPRNYLNESSIFMFESLYYDASYQTKDKLSSILSTSKYNDYIYNAGKEFNYSPIALAIKIRQEGTIGNRPTNGTTSVRCNSNHLYDPNGTLYSSPLYNFFNIGASSSPSNADLNGLCYAATTNSNYLLPWNTEEKAIRGGTKWIANQYVSAGQYTNYFQKFNTSNPNTEIWHQYMTNLEDPKSQASILYNLYAQTNMLRSSFVFYIPIYNNMPSKTELPTPGNPNNWLTSLTVKVGNTTNSVSNFNGNTTSYTINVASNINNITINSTTVAKTSYVSIDGSAKSLKTQSKQVALKNKESTFNIVVTAGNGNTKTYTIKVIKEDVPAGEQPTIEEMLEKANLNYTAEYISGITFGTGSTTLTNQLLKTNSFATIQITNNQGDAKPTGALGTGDKVKITSNNETKTFEIVLFGDINGDGTINNVDLLRVQKHIWKDTNLTGAFYKAADINKDGAITNVDLLKIQKHIWKDAIISQN